MNWKAPAIALCLLSLSACSHFAAKPESGPVIDTTAAQQDENSSQNIDAANSLEIENQSQEATASTAPSTAAAVHETDLKPHSDLIERIRRGFRFTDFDSPYIADYERWNSTHPSYLNNLFARAEPFLFHIVEEIDKRGMPMELALLPAVESAFKPKAVSRSRAAGLWQFVPATGRDFGLYTDWWYDGRGDALASTTAALEYLSKLNKMFDGDWFLTLAAYNAGPGTVMRAIKSNKRNNKTSDYQSLRLRSETRRYVPKMIALKNIINDPDKFQVKLPQIPNQPHFEVVNLPGQIDLHEFAQQAGIELPKLLHLNAGFRRWATSPSGPHRLLVPIGDSDQSQRVAKVLASAPRIEYRNHHIDSGDTLSTIARRYGLSVEAIKTANNLSSSSIRAGKNLLIPIRSDASGGSLSQTKSYPSASLESANKLVHHVRSGDTLWSIARRYKVQLQELLSWNNLSSDQVLNLNQALLVFVN